MFGSNVWGTIIGRLARTPVIVAQEQTWSYEGKPIRKLLDGQLIARLSTKFVAVSTADQERMIRIERAEVLFDLRRAETIAFDRHEAGR